MPFSFITHQSAPLSEGQSINSPEFNPFLHGTTTQALVMMSKTKWMLMPPLDLLEQHGLAPLSGELSKGGLNHAQARGQPSFGRLGAPQHAYSLECITTDYANKGEVPSTDLASWDLHSVTDEAPQTLYCNINLLLIHAARYRQLGGDVNKIKSDKIISELNAAINLFYLYLILGKYLVPNPEVAEMAKKGGLYSMNNPIDRAIQTHFSAEKLIEQLITLNLNLEAVYTNPNQENLDHVVRLLSIPHPSGPSTSLSLVCRPDLKKEENEDEKEKGNELTAQQVNKYLVSNQGTWSVSYLIWFYLTGHYHPAQFLQHENLLLGHIQLLRERGATLKKLLTESLAPLQFNEEEQALFKQPFPIILVAANDEKMTPFSDHFHEYRASKPLCLGADITMVATDTPIHQAQLQHYFAQENLAIEVILFSQLHDIRRQLPGYADQQKPKNVQKTAVDVAPAPVTAKKSDHYTVALQGMVNKINRHAFQCHGGGIKIKEKVYAKSAYVIEAFLASFLTGDNLHLSFQIYEQCMATIRDELEHKRVTTWGFFGIGRRDQTTVDLYKDLYNEAVEALTA